MDKTPRSDYRHFQHRIGAECLVFNVRKAARILAKAYDEALGPCSIKATQFSLLVGLSVKGPIPMQAFAELLKMDRTTLTRNLRPLERRGLVGIVRGEDRRARVLELTAQGKELLEEAIPRWEALQKKLTAEFGEEDAALLRAKLSALSKVAER